jgi:hypothetical protein
MPEVIVDAFADVTGVGNQFEGQLKAVRAISIIDPLAPAPSLDILGRCAKIKGCDESVPTGGGLPSQLHLLNGELLNQKIVDDDGRLHQMLKDAQSDASIITEFFRRALSRHPTAEELEHWCARVVDTDAEERKRKLEDFVWSLLNSRMFLENH